MKTKTILLLLIVVLLSGCQKKYQYVEEVMENLMYGGHTKTTKEAETIRAKNDTLAYIEAYRKYCVSQWVYEKMVKDGFTEYLDIPCGFKLYNPDGEDISDIYFVTRDERERFIESMWSSESLDGNEKVEEKTISTPKIDSAKIKELLPFFNVEKDEFDPRGLTWYKPKSAPRYTNRNGIYLYFMVQDGVAQNLRFRVQYYAEDWLFFKKIQFSIDSNAYEYIPSDTETDNGGGYIWEWFDENPSYSDKNLIYSLSNAKQAKMKLIGRQYHNIKTITKQQILDIKRTLELYNAMGGSY